MYMHFSLKVQQLIFDERGLIFLVQRLDNKECSYHPVAELFSDDKLLAEFSQNDVRLISYFAAVEEHDLDRAFLNKLHSKTASSGSR